MLQVANRVRPLPAPHEQRPAVGQTDVAQQRFGVALKAFEDDVQILLGRLVFFLGQIRLLQREAHFAGREAAQRPRPQLLGLLAKAHRQLGLRVAPLVPLQQAQGLDVMRPEVGRLLVSQDVIAGVDRFLELVLPIQFDRVQEPVEPALKRLDRHRFACGSNGWPCCWAKNRARCR